MFVLAKRGYLDSGVMVTVGTWEGEIGSYIGS